MNMRICAIWGAPQSGKTTLAVNLAHAISRGDKTVCLISPATYSELSAILGVEITEEQSLQAALRGSVGIKQTVFKVDELFFALAAPVTADAFDDDYSSEQVKSLLELAQITFDIVIVDCPSETNNLFAAWSLNMADTVILSLSGYISCVLWYAANKRALQAVQKKTVYVSSEVTSDFDYDAMHRLLKCTPDIRIPYIREAPLLQNENRLLYQLSGKKGWTYAKAINQLYEVIPL
ncbi:MAG: AAA family ATPase [Oscillospiraceae bacterium]|nr:AAA family ATPase [Oscillospiraceae bacterium]